eukprot:c11939_g1_i1.p2 GENE.c11939_g1_i1~~c11939_g1_i1.p2  ORF type:complete len:103 (-),score=22.33 c11939_g1_i1:658-966(-)
MGAICSRKSFPITMSEADVQISQAVKEEISKLNQGTQSRQETTARVQQLIQHTPINRLDLAESGAKDLAIQAIADALIDTTVQILELGSGPFLLSLFSDTGS